LSGSDALTARVTDCCVLTVGEEEVGPAVSTGFRFWGTGGATSISSWPCTEPPLLSDTVTRSVKRVVLATTGEVQVGLDTKALLKELADEVGSTVQE
jgi:hypothetical protein